MEILLVLLGLALILATVFGLIAVMVILNGWVLSILWGWFIVPAFGLPALSVSSAMGLALVVGFLTGGIKTEEESKAPLGETREEKKKRERTHTIKVTVGLLRPFLVLFVGWPIHSC